MQETQVWSLGWEDPLEEEMATHSSILAWRIPWTEEPGGLQSMELLRIGHNWATLLSLFTFMHWRRTWQPTPVFLPGESQGRGSLVGCRLRGRTELDMSDLVHSHSWWLQLFEKEPISGKSSRSYCQGFGLGNISSCRTRFTPVAPPTWVWRAMSISIEDPTVLEPVSGWGSVCDLNPGWPLGEWPHHYSDRHPHKE